MYICIFVPKGKKEKGGEGEEPEEEEENRGGEGAIRKLIAHDNAHINRKHEQAKLRSRGIGQGIFHAGAA